MNPSEREREFLVNLKVILEKSRDCSLSENLKYDDLLTDVFEDSLELYEVAMILEDDFDLVIEFSSLDSKKGRQNTIRDLYNCS